MTTIGVARYASERTANGASGGAGSASGARRTQAARAIHAIAAIAAQRSTWSLASRKRSVAYAAKSASFCHTGGAVPSTVGSRYMFGSHAYWRRYTAMQ